MDTIFGVFTAIIGTPVRFSSTHSKPDFALCQGVILRNESICIVHLNARQYNLKIGKAGTELTEYVSGIVAARSRATHAIRIAVGTLALSILGAQELSEARIHAAKALKLVKAGDLNEAEQELREAVRLAPENPVYLSDLASILRAQRKLGEPVILYRKALQTNPFNTSIRRNLALALMDSGEFKSAIQELQNVLGKDVNDAIARSAIVTAYYQTKDTANARAAVGILLKTSANVHLQITCAEAALNAGDTETAHTILLNTLDHGGQKNVAYNLLGQVYWRKNQPAQAVGAYHEGIASDPSFERNYLDLVRVLSAYNQWRPALEEVRKAVVTFPGSATLFEVKGLIETMLLLTREAMNSYARALEINPHSAKANLGMAVAQRAAGMTAEAAATFERGIEKFPDDALLRQEYGLMVLAAAQSGDATVEGRGIALLQQAIRLKPGLSEAQYQLGNILLRKGDIDKALNHLQQAAALDPSRSKIQYALSRAYRRSGRDNDSRDAFQQFERLKATEERSNPGFAAVQGQLK